MRDIFEYQDFTIGSVPKEALPANNESEWHQPWSEPVRFKILPWRQIALAASGLFAPVLDPNSQITTYLESRWHQEWSQPVRFRRLATAHQQVLGIPNRYLPKPDVTATMNILDNPFVSTAIFGALVLNEPPPVPPDLTSVNVSVDEVDETGASTSVRGDE